MRWLAVLAFLILPLSGWPAADPAEFGDFGRLNILHPPKGAAPSSVVIFPSGDGGWEDGVRNKARLLASMGALVIGFDTVHYLRKLEHSRQGCAYPAGDFEALSQYVQHTLGMPEYIHPVITGYSSGATLAYVALAQSPPGTFLGAISFGFCPDLDTSAKFCRGHGLESLKGIGEKGAIFLPVGGVNAPWVLLHGLADGDCLPGETEKFVKGMKGADLVLLPKVGHGFGVYSNWGPQFRKAFAGMAVAPVRPPPVEGVGNLPVVEVPAKAPQPGGTFAVLVSGDGGWAGIDRELSSALAEEGIPVAGLDSLKYFWNERTPEGTAHDVGRIISAYMEKWNAGRVLLIGYSRGADVLPFIYNRLPGELKGKVVLTVLVAPAKSTAFVIHVTDFLGGTAPGSVPILPEVERMEPGALLCFHGTEEKDTLCTDLAPPRAECYAMPGSHHLGGRYREIARIILERLRLKEG